MEILRNLYIKYMIGGAKLSADAANKALLFEQKSEMLRYFTLQLNRIRRELSKIV